MEQRKIGAIKTVIRNEIPHVTVAMTVSKRNVKEIPEVVNLCETIGINTLRVSRLVPIGRGKMLRDELLSPVEIKNLYETIFEFNKILEQKKSKLRIAIGVSTGIWCIEDPNFLSKFPDSFHVCTAGYTSLAVLPNGDVFPCRRLPILVGNLTKQSLFEIYYSSDKLWQLRNINNTNSTCRNCPFFDRCYGGAKCMAYGYFGNPFAPDPNCWKLFKELPKENKFKEFKESEDVLLNSKYVTGDKVNLQNEFEIIDEKKAKYIFKVNTKNIENLINQIIRQKPEVAMISFQLSMEEMTLETGKIIISFLEKLRENKINFKVTKPLPRCLFGLKYEQIVRKFNIPRSCFECLELFILQENGMIRFCKAINNRLGPKLKYMKDRNQIYEYFKTFYDRVKPNEKCRGCIWYIRGKCDLKCY